MVGSVRICVIVHVGLAQPWSKQSVVLCCRTEVPDDGVAITSNESKADELIHSPGTNVGTGHITDVSEVEGKKCA